VQGLGKVEKKGSGNTSRMVVTASNISASTLLSLIKQYYGKNKLDGELSVDVNRKDTEITFKLGGGTTNWYVSDLQRVKASGIVTSYSAGSSTTGYNAAGAAIKFDEVYNNPSYSNKLKVAAGADPDGTGSKNNGNDGGGSSSALSTYILVGAAALVVIILIMRRKKK
jgi:hypothetical protein